MAAGTAAPSGYAVTSNDGPVRAEPEGRSPMAHAFRMQAADIDSPSTARAFPMPLLVIEFVQFGLDRSVEQIPESDTTIRAAFFKIGSAWVP